MSEYFRGVEDAIQMVLILIKECHSLDELKERLEEMLSDIMERKYERIKRILKRI